MFKPGSRIEYRGIRNDLYGQQGTVLERSFNRLDRWCLRVILDSGRETWVMETVVVACNDDDSEPILDGTQAGSALTGRE